MTEHEMEELLWNHSDKLLNESLSQFKRQPQSVVGRADLVFKDRLGRLLVVELKKGILPRGAIFQLWDYFGMLKQEFKDTPVELMVVANSIPQERVLACLQLNIEPREISEKRFRDVAAEVGFEFGSERNSSPAQLPPISKPANSVASSKSYPGLPRKIERAWYYCNQAGRNPTFLAFVNAKGSCSMRVFAANDGSFMGKQYAGGDFQEAFRDFILASNSLSVSRQPSLEKECKERLPSTVLAELRRQLHS